MQKKKPKGLCQQQDAELCSTELCGTEQHRERAAQRVVGIAQHLQWAVLKFPRNKLSLLPEGDGGAVLLGHLQCCGCAQCPQGSPSAPLTSR